MKCKKCGHRSTTISAMAKHYRLKHPSAMKPRKGSESTKTLLKQLLKRLG